MPWREYQRNQGGGKQHLNDGNIVFVTNEVFTEWLGVVEPETFGGA